MAAWQRLYEFPIGQTPDLINQDAEPAVGPFPKRAEIKTRPREMFWSRSRVGQPANRLRASGNYARIETMVRCRLKSRPTPLSEARPQLLIRGRETGTAYASNVAIRSVSPIRRQQLVIERPGADVGEGDGSGIVVGREGMQPVAGGNVHGVAVE